MDTNPTIYHQYNIRYKNNNNTNNNKKKNYTNYYYTYKRSSFLWSIIIVIVVIFGEIQGLLGECPRLCECKWKRGKESVLCLNANLTAVPLELDPGTQVLDLSGNEITTIPRDAFSSANLPNLQKLFLVRCRLKIIDRFAFRKLINLVELDLSQNSLTMIPTHALESIHELRELKLNSNPIQRVLNNAFQHVDQLVRLELTGCRITTIESKAFAGLVLLEWLKIDYNQIINISPTTLTVLQNLHGLELAANPWNCSCSLRPLRQWMQRENIPYDVSPICKHPERLSNRSWDKVDLDEFACAPHILAPDIRAHGIEGRNVTMSCMVTGVPEPSVRWSVRNRVIVNLTSSNLLIPTAQGRKVYVANLQQNESNLTILTAEIQDAGVYTCVAENKAGRVEASVTLAVSRRPSEALLSAKIIIASIIVAILFVIVSSLAVICACTLRKRRQIGRWNTQRRTESYEKIEMMNHKPTGFGRGFKSPRKPPSGGGDGGGECGGAISVGRTAMGGNGIDGNGRRSGNGIIDPNNGCTITTTNFMKPYGENGISVVGQMRRNGDYRTVPSEDDGTGYEDNIESTTTTLSNNYRGRDKWKNGCGGIGDDTNLSIKSPTNGNEHNSNINGNDISHRNNDLKDLHIPRLIEFSDATPDSGPSSLNGGQFDPPKTCTASSSSTNSITPSALYIKPDWTQHIMRKQPQSTSEQMSTVATTGIKAGPMLASTSLSNTSSTTALLKNNHHHHIRNNNNNNHHQSNCSSSSDKRSPAESDCDNDRKYPDLLDISSFSNNNSPPISVSSAINNINNSNGSNLNLINSTSINNSAFCTFPRKKHNSGHFMKQVSDSQSPLLASDSCSSRYSSAGIDSSIDLAYQCGGGGGGGGGGAVGSGTSSGRRLSIDSFSNYTLNQNGINSSSGRGESNGVRNSSGNTSNDNGRACSVLNLMNIVGNSQFPQINNTRSQIQQNQLHNHHRNPSLPSSPIKSEPKITALSPSATPLLDFTPLAARQSIIGNGTRGGLTSCVGGPGSNSNTGPPLEDGTPSPSTSSNAASAYDYHAAQLERFLEEYRNLQEQLCKMKETCDSIRKKDSSLSRGSVGQSAKFADPVMYSTAAALNSSGSPAGLLLDDTGMLTGTSTPSTVGAAAAAVAAAVGSTTAANAATASISGANPKGILKNKSLIPGQPPDPPPYWLHRNALLKRLQDPSSVDFFQS